MTFRLLSPFAMRCVNHYQRGRSSPRPRLSPGSHDFPPNWQAACNCSLIHRGNSLDDISVTFTLCAALCQPLPERQKFPATPLKPRVARFPTELASRLQLLIDTPGQ